jgi:hypothetical protein
MVIEVVKIVAYSAAAAASILLIGGAVKKVIGDPADECLEAGKDLALSLVGPATVKLAGPRATTTLPDTSSDDRSCS